jgi:hypothetical protein
VRASGSRAHPAILAAVQITKGKIGEIPLLLAFENSCANANISLLETLHP